MYLIQFSRCCRVWTLLTVCVSVAVGAGNAVGAVMGVGVGVGRSGGVVGNRHKRVVGSRPPVKMGLSLS